MWVYPSHMHVHTLSPDPRCSLRWSFSHVTTGRGTPQTAQVKVMELLTLTVPSVRLYSSTGACRAVDTPACLRLWGRNCMCEKQLESDLLLLSALCPVTINMQDELLPLRLSCSTWGTTHIVWDSSKVDEHETVIVLDIFLPDIIDYCSFPRSQQFTIGSALSLSLVSTARWLADCSETEADWLKSHCFPFLLTSAYSHVNQMRVGGATGSYRTLFPGTAACTSVCARVYLCVHVCVGH